jgi:hypothetical protein
MKVQFDHEFQSSFFLFLDNHFLYKGGASGEKERMPFLHYGETMDVEAGLDTYYAPSKQLVSDAIPSGDNAVYINGARYGQTSQGSKLLTIDHYDGRVILNPTHYGTNLDISGDFAKKDINLYITNENEEQLILESDFILAGDDETYMQSVSGLNDLRYVIPAAFISLNSTQNEPYGFGGEDDTKQSIRLVCIGDSNYSLDGMLSLCRDLARESFPVLSYGEFPYGEYWHIKKTGYSFTGIEKEKEDGKFAYVEEAVTSKLFDRSNSKIPRSLRVGFADIQISNIRYPRAK